MLGIQTTLIAAAIAAAAAGAGVWHYQSVKYEGKISALKLSHEQQVSAASKSAFRLTEIYQGNANEAVKNAEKRLQANAVASASLRADRDRLRIDLNSTNARIASATREAVNQYALAVADVFEQCTSRYSDVAEKADRHYSDSIMLIEAWPSPDTRLPAP